MAYDLTTHIIRDVGKAAIKTLWTRKENERYEMAKEDLKIDTRRKKKRKSSESNGELVLMKHGSQ